MPLPQSPFQASLLPASFRGVPFGVLDSRIAAGRRVETHEYVFRDEPFAEDLGRRARRIEFTAFLLGDDVAAQADDLLRAVEQKGAGMLVHPSYGTMSMQIDGPAELTEHWERGRYIEVRLSFVEPGQDLYPLGDADTQAGTQSAASDAALGSGKDFAGSVNGAAGDAVVVAPSTVPDFSIAGGP